MRHETFYIIYDIGLVDIGIINGDSVFFYQFTLYNARHFIVRLIIEVIYIFIYILVLNNVYNKWFTVFCNNNIRHQIDCKNPNEIISNNYKRISTDAGILQ